MADHSYVLGRGTIAIAEMEDILRNINQSKFRGRLTVRRNEAFERVDKTYKAAWFFASGWLPPRNSIYGSKDEDLKFPVWLQRDAAVVEFRHSSNMWEWWAQQITMHEVARAVHGTITTDGKTGHIKVNAAQFGSSFPEYLKKAGLEGMGYLDFTPEEFRT